MVVGRPNSSGGLGYAWGGRGYGDLNRSASRPPIGHVAGATALGVLPLGDVPGVDTARPSMRREREAPDIEAHDGAPARRPSMRRQPGSVHPVRPAPNG